MIVKIEIECKTIGNLMAQLVMVFAAVYREKKRLGMGMNDEDFYKADATNLSLSDSKNGSHKVEVLPF